MLPKTTIAVTGASGFVGRNLISYLKLLGYSVLEIGRTLTDSNSLLIDDLTCEEINKRGIVSIVHLAGKAHDLKMTSEPEEYYITNVELTRRVYGAFLASQARTFIFLSSVKAAADSVTGELHENIIPHPMTHYGKSKLLAEQCIIEEKCEGKFFYILRPCMIHGHGNKGNLNLLYRFVKRGIPYPLAAFTNRRSFLSIQNLCFVIQELLSRPGIASGVYHLADTEPISTNELIGLMAGVLQKPARLWRIPRGLVSALARLGDVLHLPLNTERLQKLTENYIVDNRKIRAAIGQELPVTTREGLRSTIASFQV